MKKKLNPAHIEALKKVINQAPYPSLLSMKITCLESGKAVMEIEIAPEHFQPMRVVHGGVFASIIDTTAYWAVYCDIEDPNTLMTSIDLKLNYLAPAGSQTQKIIAEGHQIKIGKSTGYSEVSVFDQSKKLLAHGTSTLMMLPGKTMDATLPPKFLSTDAELP